MIVVNETTTKSSRQRQRLHWQVGRPFEGLGAVRRQDEGSECLRSEREDVETSLMECVNVEAKEAIEKYITDSSDLLPGCLVQSLEIARCHLEWQIAPDAPEYADRVLLQVNDLNLAADAFASVLDATISVFQRKRKKMRGGSPKRVCGMHHTTVTHPLPCPFSAGPTASVGRVFKSTRAGFSNLRPRSPLCPIPERDKSRQAGFSNPKPQSACVPVPERDLGPLRQRRLLSNRHELHLHF